MKSMSVCLMAASALASALAGAASGAVIEYTDRASFEAALGSFTLLDFENLGNQVNLGTSVDFGDFNFSNPGGSWAICCGNFGAPTGQLGDQNNGNTTISLKPGYKGLGMDIGLLFGAGSVNLTLRDSFGNIVASGNRAVSDNDALGQPGSTFYGWISDSDDLGTLTLNQGGFPTIDNAIFGNRVPAPGAAAILGLAGLTAARRR